MGEWKQLTDTATKWSDDQFCHLCCTHGCYGQEDLNKETSESVFGVFVFHFEEVVATLLEKLHTGLKLLNRVHLIRQIEKP